MVGLGHRCHGPSHADAVGAHGRYPGLSVGVQYRDTHGLGVLPAQFEDVAGLNTTDDREGLPTGGTGLTVDDSTHVHPSIHADVPVDVHSGVVHVVLVGAGGHPGPTLQRRVGVDNEVIHPDRTEAPRRGAQGGPDVVALRGSYLRGAGGVEELLLLEGVVAAQQQEGQFAVDPVDEGLDLVFGRVAGLR